MSLKRDVAEKYSRIEELEFKLHVVEAVSASTTTAALPPLATGSVSNTETELMRTCAISAERSTVSIVLQRDGYHACLGSCSARASIMFLVMNASDCPMERAVCACWVDATCMLLRIEVWEPCSPCARVHERDS